MKYLDKNFFSYLFSALLIKKLGHSIDLYCDKNSYEMYSFIPYDNINIVDFDNDGVDSKFWIWGKIKTHMLMTEPYIHIDGDVFLFRDIIGDKILNGEYDAVVQSRENDKTLNLNFNVYTESLTPFNEKISSDINWNKYGLEAYNCGVVGFGDMGLKNKYALKVAEILTKLSTDDEFKIKRKKYDGMFLIAEQSLLYYMLTENNVKPLEIIPYEEIQRRNCEWFTIADEIGYAHMWGYCKYKDDVIEKIKYKIKRFFPEHIEVLTKFNKICNNL